MTVIAARSAMEQCAFSLRRSRTSKRRWFGTDRVSEDLKEWFLRSKRGEPVTDWYSSNDPELNIVQQDAGTVYGKKTVVLDHVTFQAHNAYDCPTLFHVNRWTIRLPYSGRTARKPYRMLHRILMRDCFASGACSCGPASCVQSGLSLLVPPYKLYWTNCLPQRSLSASAGHT